MEKISHENIGEQFLQFTKYSKNQQLVNRKNYPYDSSRFKTYPDAEKTFLPGNSPQTMYNFSELLRLRRSCRTFHSNPLRLGELSYLLWASSGISQVTPNFEFRTAPSAGALYPIETYVCVNRVENLPAGIYHWDILDNTLELIRHGNIGAEMRQAALDQKMVESALVVVIWTGTFSRSKWKYKERAYRYVFLDAGHIAAQFSIAAVDIELATCQIGAFFDDDINQILQIDGITESALYMSVVGKKQ